MKLSQGTVHAGSLSKLATEFRLFRRESIEDPKIDLLHSTTSIKLVDSIASFTRLIVISIVDKGISRILAPISFIGRL
jgi:hypothetical protein